MAWCFGVLVCWCVCVFVWDEYVLDDSMLYTKITPEIMEILSGYSFIRFR